MRCFRGLCRAAGPFCVHPGDRPAAAEGRGGLARIGWTLEHGGRGVGAVIPQPSRVGEADVPTVPPLLLIRSS